MLLSRATRRGAAQIPLSRDAHCVRSTTLQSVLQSRSISAYGYVQAEALIFSEHGNPQDVLRLHRHSISPAHSNLVTLRTLAAPLNPADINQIQGTYPTRPDFSQSLGTPQPSAVPGGEGCFEVVATGGNVKSVSKGDWVIPRRTGLGSWRTHGQVEEDKIVKVQDRSGLSSLQVATVSVNPVTAWRMLKDFEDLQEGDWWIQNGANSGVGRAALQLGRLRGLKSIAVVREREDESRQRALESELEELGADHVVGANQIAEKGFKDQVKEWTEHGKRPLKLALNCVGGKPATDMSKVLANGGTMVTYGAMGRNPMKIGAGPLIFNDLSFRGFWVTQWADKNPEEKKKVVEEVFDLYRSGKFRDVPYEEIPWTSDTKENDLRQAVQGTLEGFRGGKGVFVFK